MGILRTDRITGLGGANAIKGSVEMRGAQNLRAEIVNSNADFNLGSSNYTVECWLYRGGTTGTASSIDQDLVMLWNNTNNRRSYGLYRDSGGYLGLIGSSDGTNSDMQSYHSYNFSDVNAWYHIAAVRISNTATIYVNGAVLGSATVSGSFYENTVDNLVVGGQLAGASYDSKIARGFISNMRLIIGDGIYTGAFTPPANELTVTPNTKLLCCQSPSNILQEATGKTLVAHRSSVNDSFAKASTFAPDKGEDYGTTFGENTVFDTLSYMVPPGGTTAQSNRGRGVFAQGYSPGDGASAKLNYFEISSGGITQSFGNLTQSTYTMTAGSSSTRGVLAGGYLAAASPIYDINTIEYVTIATTSNAIDFGDRTTRGRTPTAVSSETRVCMAGGYSNPTYTNIIDFITTATTGDATNFGDLGNPRSSFCNSMQSTTRGIFAGGYQDPSPHPAVNTLEYITMASAGDATNFGDMTSVGTNSTGGSMSSNTRGVTALGNAPGATNIINYVTIATTGDATDFGDMTTTRKYSSSCSSHIRGVIIGGETPTYVNTIEYITIATTGNSLDFGDVGGGLSASSRGAACSDCHGGLS